MYYIQKNGAPVATSDPNEVTKENFLVEPGAENKVWCKLEKYEFDRETGEKRTLINQVRADNPGDFDRFVREWKHQKMTITMLHDPREGKPTGSVPTKLAILEKRMKKEKGDVESKPANKSSK